MRGSGLSRSLASTSTPATKPSAGSRRWRAARTRRRALGIGSFGGLFPSTRPSRDPVLVASADGVGTKLKVAFMTGVHDTVAPIWSTTASTTSWSRARAALLPRLHRDRPASPDVAEQIVERHGARLPRERLRAARRRDGRDAGLLRRRRIRPRGFIVGVVDARADHRRARHRAGDVLIGLPSTGLHTNGYSLARRIVVRRARAAASTPVPELGATVGDALLRPHRSYLRRSWPLLDTRLRQGHGAHHRRRHHRESAAHAARGLGADIDRASWTVPPLFAWLQRAGGSAGRRDVPRVQHGRGPGPRVRARRRRRHPCDASRWSRTARGASGSVV